MRDKCDERRGVQTYSEITIGKAIENRQSFYRDRQSQIFSCVECNKSGPGKINHLQVAKDVVAKLGEENLAFIGNMRIFRKWNGQSWDEIDDRSINKVIVEHLSKTQGVTKNVIESITDLIRTNVFRQDVT